MRKPLLAVAAVLCSALPVRGQDAPRAELFAGYSFVRSDQRNLNGWNASLAVGLAGSLSLVADASGHYGSAGRRQLNLMAGARPARFRGRPARGFFSPPRRPPPPRSAILFSSAYCFSHTTPLLQH